MRKKALNISAAMAALLLALSLLAACGGGNPFVGAWDSDARGISLVFNEDGTGVQSDTAHEIPFTYTVDGNTATITAVDYGLSAECVIEDDMLVMDGDIHMVRRDAPGYTPESAPSGGRESEISGTWSNADGSIVLTFDGEETFLFNDSSSSGAGTYTYDGETLTVSMLDENGEVAEYNGYLDSDGNIVIALWGESVVYTQNNE